MISVLQIMMCISCILNYYILHIQVCTGFQEDPSQVCNHCAQWLGPMTAMTWLSHSHCHSDRMLRSRSALATWVPQSRKRELHAAVQLHMSIVITYITYSYTVTWKIVMHRLHTDYICYIDSEITFGPHQYISLYPFKLIASHIKESFFKVNFELKHHGYRICLM